MEDKKKRAIEVAAPIAAQPNEQNEFVLLGKTRMDVRWNRILMEGWKESKKGFGMPPETPGACHKSELEKARLNSRSNYCWIYGPLNQLDTFNRASETRKD